MNRYCYMSARTGHLIRLAKWLKFKVNLDQTMNDIRWDILQALQAYGYI